MTSPDLTRGLCCQCFSKLDVSDINSPKKPYRDSSGDNWGICHACYDKEHEALSREIVNLRLKIEHLEDCIYDDGIAAMEANEHGF